MSASSQSPTPPRTPKWIESFNPEVARGFLNTNDKMTGLPGFLGVRFVDFSPGRVLAEMEVKPDLLTPFGNMHGGVLSALCDHILGCVCYPHMKPGQWAATMEFKLNLLAPVSKGTVSAEARLLSMTRSTAVVQINIENEGRDVCAAQGSVLIRDAKR